MNAVSAMKARRDRAPLEAIMDLRAEEEALRYRFTAQVITATLAGWTQHEIADHLGFSRGSIARVLAGTQWVER